MTMTAKQLTFCDGLITGLGMSSPSSNLPLLVMIPGGGSRAAQFDIPGRSFLEISAANGFSAVALNRPAQADSAPLALDPTRDSGAFAANAERLSSAIDEIWSSKQSAHPGVVIYGSSIGGAISLHMAADWSKAKRAWPLLGVSVADIGQSPPPALVDTWRSLPPLDIINLADYFPVFFAGVPPWALPPRPPGQVPPPMNLRVPRAELQEVVGAWLREWKIICSGITVPVQYCLAQHDTAWHVSSELVQEFSQALRERSPYVESSIVAGAIHGISTGALGVSHLLNMLSFVSRCAVAARIPEILS